MTEPWADFINIHKNHDDEVKNEYIMMVYGWRMQFEERVIFAEIAFKRLYWSDNKSRFGFYSWPTGYFYNPVHNYDVLDSLGYFFGHEQNYENSEVVARHSGWMLKNLLNSSDFIDRNINILAHSRGNLVVSEALRSSGDKKIVDHYIASQAAESESAYNPFTTYFEGFEFAWRAANIEQQDFDTVFDFPPNYFAHVVPPKQNLEQGKNLTVKLD